MNPQVLEQIGYNKSDIEENRSAVGKSEKATFELLPSESRSFITKLAFLILVKSSNKIYRPKKGAIINGVSLLETRYSCEAMNKIYGNTIIPIISSNDKLFLKRHFHFCHTKVTNGNTTRIHMDLQ